MLWRVSRPIRTRSKPPGFILPCQPALADRPPAGPGWLHEIKFDGYRVIARKDGERVRFWARTTSDCSNAFTGIRNAVAALPVDSFVLDGEASPVERKLSFQGGYVEKLDRILSEAYWPEHRLRAPQAATKS